MAGRSDWPSDPIGGSRGATPSLSAATNASATSGRTMLRPRQSAFTRCSSAARPTSPGNGSPCEVRCDWIVSRVKRPASCADWRTPRRAPTPVFRP